MIVVRHMSVFRHVSVFRHMSVLVGLGTSVIVQQPSKDAPLAAFERLAPRFPVFHVVPRSNA